MMTVNKLYDWLSEQRELYIKSVNLDKYDGFMIIPQFVCHDGTEISIQASPFHYCERFASSDKDLKTPEDARQYKSFEISMIEKQCNNKHKLINVNSLKTVGFIISYYIPIEDIVAEINSHNG